MNSMNQHNADLWKLLSLLQQLLTRVGAHQTATGAALGLTNLRLGVLGAVYRNQNCTMRQVAQDRYVAPPAATRTVNELVKEGLLERVSDDRDRRIVRLRITAKGREAVGRVHQEASVLLAQVLGQMRDSEQRALLKGLDAFIKAVTHVEQDAEKSQQRSRNRSR